MPSRIQNNQLSSRRITQAFLCAACLCLVSPPRAQQKATLVSDINKLRRPLNSLPKPKRAGKNNYQESTRFAQLSGMAIFQATAPKSSYELFASKGTPSSSILLKDVVTGSSPSYPEQFAVSGSKVFFRANDGVHGLELWVTDGTTRGTVLVKDLVSGYSSSQPEEICPLGSSGKVVFRAYDKTTGSELYISDGTAKGTHLLKDLESGSGSSSPAYLRTFHDGKRDLVVFQAWSSTIGVELYVTDGTASGTKLLKDIESGGGFSNPHHFQVLGNKVLFTASTSSMGSELWITDGTPTGTTLVKDVYKGAFTGTDLYHGVRIGKKFYFAGTTAASGKEIWVTDGTTKGTRLVADTNPGSGDGLFLYGTALGNKILYQGSSTGAGKEPWILNTVIGTARQLLDLNSGKSASSPDSFVTSGTKVYFCAYVPSKGRELIVSDGTAKGTKLLKDIYAGSSSSSCTSLTSLSPGRIVFVANHLGTKNLWASDGTEAGTIPVPVGKAQLPSKGSYPQGAVAFGDKLLFSANDGVTGQELWTTDGTDKGTRLVKDIYPGTDSWGWPRRSFPLALVSLDKQVLFSADDGQSLGRELWTTDGTTKGTRVLVDILTGFGSSYPSYLSKIQDRVYFAAAGYDQAQPRNYIGQELFVTDGTASGTRFIADLYPGFTSSSPRGFTQLGTSNRFVFSAFTPSPKSLRDSLGWELWGSDGTTAGTKLLMDIETGSTASFPRSFQALGNVVYFVATTSAYGDEVWVTDGTQAGTRILKDLVQGSAGSKPRYLCASGGKLYFHAWTSSTGFELFTSDGTSTGTKLFKDLTTGSSSSYPIDLTAVGSRYFYFSANSNSGKEPWRSDGTPAGTKVYADIWPGGYSSKARGFALANDQRFVSLGNRVFMAATAEATGEEIYYVDNGATATRRGMSCLASSLTSGDPVLGSTTTIRGTTKAGFLANLVFLGRRTINPLPLGGSCRFYLDLTGPLVLLHSSTGTSYSASIPIPSTPTLLGARMSLQALHPGTSFPLSSGFSNRIEWVLGK